MHKFDGELFQSVLDLNESVAFEYDILNDVMSFAPNIVNYIPCPLRIAAYIREIEFRGKICPEDVKRALAFLTVSEEDPADSVRMEYLRFMNFSGEYVWYQLKGKVICNGEGIPELIYGTYTYVDGNHLLEGELEERCTKDPLTGLDNEETILSKIARYFEELPDMAVPGVILAEIGNYARLSERCGQQTADCMFAEAARICRRALRGADLVGRYGSRRIVIVMKGICDERICCERASYIIDAVQSAWRDYNVDFDLTVNVGIAVVKEEDDWSLDWLLERAKEALACAEKKGNTYVLYAGALYPADSFRHRKITGREIDLVKNVLGPVMSWAYAVDEEYNLIYKNELLEKRIAGECEGLCYAVLKRYSHPCPDCPIAQFGRNTTSYDSGVYSPSLRRVLNMRTTRLTMRSGMHVYILANVKEDAKMQADPWKAGAHTYQRAILEVCDLIWEIDLHKNVCSRIQERGIMSVREQGSIAYRKLVAHYLDFLVYPEDREVFREAADVDRLREAQKLGREQVRRELRLMRPDNEYQWYTVTTVLLPNETACLFGMNIQELKKSIAERFAVEEKYSDMMRCSEFQKEVAQSNERYEHVNELTGNFVFEYNVSEGKYYVCTLFEDMFEIKKGMLENEWSLLEGLEPYEKDAQKFRDFLTLVKEEPDTHEMTLRLYNKYHKPIWFTVTVQTLKGLGNVLERLIGIIQNVNTEMEIKAELEYRADFDSVTGLYNSDCFYRRATEILFHNPDERHVIISVDIDHFRMINDRFGIETGNRCLKFMGRIIQENLGSRGIAGRYQGDIFAILLVCETEDEYAEFVDRLNRRFNFPEAAQCGSTLSFGVYNVVDINIPVQLMCDRARLAKMAIKGSKLVNCAVYDDSIRLKQRAQSEIESEMQLALDNHEFVMYLQPKYDIKTEKVAGAEALVRWRHPLKGLRMPGEFLPLFENNGFIKILDEYIWECAAAYIAKSKKAGKAVPISINISRLHINTTDLVHVLTDLTKKYEIEPEYLELEITETIFMEDVSQLYNTMRDLKAAGFVIEMDDFGSGYSSLNMLRNAPIDVIKIDRFFLDEIMSTERGRIIVENTIVMSKQLGLRVVAEGVETRDQKEFLLRAGCDIAQGYYYSKPIPAEEFEKLL